MTEEKESHSSPGEAWHEVGQQLRSLGESLAPAFKATWEGEETRQHLEKMQEGLEVMAAEIGQITKQAAASEEAQKIKIEMEKAAQSAQTAGQQTVDEVRPQLLSAFRTLRTELDQIINRMEEQKPASETSPDDSKPGSETAA